MCAIFLQVHLCQLQVLLSARRCLSLHNQWLTTCSRQLLVVLVMLLAGLCAVLAMAAMALNVLRAVHVVHGVHAALVAVVRGVAGMPGIRPWSMTQLSCQGTTTGMRCRKHLRTPTTDSS